MKITLVISYLLGKLFAAVGLDYNDNTDRVIVGVCFVVIVLILITLYKSKSDKKEFQELKDIFKKIFIIITLLIVFIALMIVVDYIFY